MKPAYLMLLVLWSAAAQAAEFSATLDWGNRRHAAFTVAGVVDKVAVQAGEQVKPKQLLAQLEQQPFVLARNAAQARVDMLVPRMFDAKQDYDQAQELYQRTVLSQIELQKAETLYKGVQAEQVMARSEYELAQWQLGKASLIASCLCVVTEVKLLPGMVINSENQAIAMIALAEAGVMDAEAVLDNSFTPRMQQNVQIVVGKQQYAGSVISLHVVSGKRIARVQFRHNADGQLFAGQTAKVIF